MLFNSYIFVFAFFPICLLGYYGLLHGKRRRQARVFLTVMSFWFYGYFNLSYLLIMVCSIGVNFAFHRLLSREEGAGDGGKAPVSRKTLMLAAVTFNLGVLFYFKYFDFFLSTVNGAFGTSFVLRGILLPLGISFFTFQQISFVVDTYRGEVRNCPLDEYALFVSSFPQLIAGPIVNHGEMLLQFEKMGEKKPDWERIAGGFTLFTLGMAKKVLLADTFGAGVDYGYQNTAALGRLDAALVIVFYALQLYFDFSGYCDMAVGIGRMLGVEIPVNFNSPYKAVNIVDFWKRWHITLNRFFTKYVYIPPYSILYWNDVAQENHMEATMQEYAYIARTLLAYDNVRVYYFPNQEGIVTDLNNYADYTHYHRDINRYMTECFADGNCEVNSAEEMEQVLDETRDMIERFDFETLFSVEY